MRLDRPRLPSTPRANRATALNRRDASPAPLHGSFLRAFRRQALSLNSPVSCEGRAFGINQCASHPGASFGRRAGVHFRSLLGGPPGRASDGKNRDSLTREVDSQTWEALVRPGRKNAGWGADPFGEGSLKPKSVARPAWVAHAAFHLPWSEQCAASILASGHVPFPRTSSAPMINRTANATKPFSQSVPARLPLLPPAFTSRLKFLKKCEPRSGDL